MAASFIIDKFVLTGHLTPDTKMVLINAVYLKADWRTQFNSDDTKEGIFYTNTGEQINVPMMELKTDFGYKNSEELGAKILELPYKVSSFGYFAAWPTKQGATILELLYKKLALSTRTLRIWGAKILELPYKLSSFGYENSK